MISHQQLPLLIILSLTALQLIVNGFETISIVSWGSSRRKTLPILEATKLNDRFTSTMKKEMVKNERTTTPSAMPSRSELSAEQQPNPPIGAVLTSIQRSLTTLTLKSLRTNVEKVPQLQSTVLPMLDQLLPPIPIPVPEPEVPTKRDFKDELGVLAPIGFFDPIGFTSTIDYEQFRSFRAAELKHGRVAMVAFLGYLVPEGVRLPDWAGISFAQVPNGVSAVRALPSFVWGLVFLAVWWLESVLIQEDGAEPGTFGVGYFGERLEGSVKRDKLNKELQNGRLAMLAMMEIFTHDIARPDGEGLFVLHHF